MMRPMHVPSATRMERRPFGTSNRLVPVIGQGTWYLDQVDRRVAIETLRRGLDAGMTHIDTAEMYGTEDLVGEAIAHRRDEVFLVSKVLPQHASRAGTIAACEASLRRLRTSRLDSYLLHWRGDYPLAETIDAFEHLRDQGKIDTWGVSNFDVDDLNETRTIARGAQLVCDQVLYHLEERAIEHAVLPWCERNRVAVVAYSPLGHGRSPDEHSPGGRVLAAIAAAHGATPRQVALRFLTRHPPLFAVVKASRPEHAVENAGAGTFTLTAAEIQRIERAFPLGPPPRFLPTL
jgi:diketogulonate reductase-like aldo/keto reductase